MAIKEYYGKTGDTPLIQLIISYDTNVKDTDTACKHTEQIADYLNGDYQILTSVHKED